MNTPPTRLTLHQLNAAQKLLVIAIVATVGCGYLGALANLFAQNSAADGKATIKLEEFFSVARTEGVGKLIEKVQQSLGVDDVVRRYHGAAGRTGMHATLDGAMREKIVEKLTKDDGDKPEVRDRAERLRQMLIAWSKLPDDERKKTYEEGTPVDDDGAALFGKKDAKSDDLVTVVKDTLDNYCVRCHKPGGVEAEAGRFPLESYEQCNLYCVPDHGVSAKALALTTHVHLLGFAVLFAMTGFLFSLTRYAAWVRVIFVPWALGFQLLEIACWWLAKLHVGFAYAIFYLGPVVGIGLLVQLLGVLFDLCRRPRVPEVSCRN